MPFINSGGFVFSGGGGELSALFDGYFNKCKPDTVGLNRQQVTVRVRQGVTQDTIVITVQPSNVIVPSQQNIENPVRAEQPESVNQEIVVSQIPTRGNRVLEQFNNEIIEEPGATFLIPPVANQQQIAQQAAQALGKEVAAQASTAVDLADEAARTAASTVDDAALVANKLRNLSPQAIQQVLQKTGMSFTQAREIANAAATNVDEAAALLRQQGFTQIANLNRQITSQVNRVIASVC